MPFAAARANVTVQEGLISADDGLLTPTYYLSPTIDREWLERTLTEGFAGLRDCFFPPDAMENSLRVLHKLGYTGTIWDLLVPGLAKDRKGRKRHGGK